MGAIVVPCPECSTPLTLDPVMGSTQCRTCGWTRGNSKVQRDVVYKGGMNRAQRRRLEREARKAKRRRVEPLTGEKTESVLKHLQESMEQG